MVSTVLLNLYVTLAVMSGAIGANGVRDFATTKAVVQAKAQLQVTCPAPRPRSRLAAWPRPVSARA